MENQNTQLRSQLHSQKGFFRRFFTLCANHETDKEAYEEVEEEYKSFFVYPRYTSYKSFRSALNNFNRKQLGK